STFEPQEYSGNPKQKDRRVGEQLELHSCPQVARARMSSVEPNPTWPRRGSINPTKEFTSNYQGFIINPIPLHTLGDVG
ncbi:hypothetical protein Tco_1181480, partial [Tanacetum coccineum]